MARLLPPENASLEQISREVGVSIHTLERWRSHALAAPAQRRDWSAGARLSTVANSGGSSQGGSHLGGCRNCSKPSSKRLNTLYR